MAELSTHDNQRVTKALNDGLQAALTGTKTPEQAMKDAQREADAHPAARYKYADRASVRRAGASRGERAERDDDAARAATVHGWLLLLPALVLLVAVHALAGGRDALATASISTPKGAGRRVFVGLDNYRAMVDDPVFWQALVEQPVVRASARSRCRSRSRC